MISELYKFSIIMPYYDRPDQLVRTLESYRDHYGDRKNEWEVMIVEDYMNFLDPVKHKRLIEIVIKEFHDLPINLGIEKEWKVNPSTKFNQGAIWARGHWFVLTSPECLHETPILFDEQVMKSRAYTVCACKALKEDGSFKKWFQHSVHTPKCFHFCSLITRNLFFGVGGFDEAFANGYCFDDDAFLARVRMSGAEIVQRDDLVVTHQWHKKNKPSNFKALWERNKRLYEERYDD